MKLVTRVRSSAAWLRVTYIVIVTPKYSIKRWIEGPQVQKSFCKGFSRPGVHAFLSLQWRWQSTAELTPVASVSDDCCGTVRAPERAAPASFE